MLQDVLPVTFLILQFNFQLFTVTVMTEYIFKHYALVWFYSDFLMFLKIQYKQGHFKLHDPHDPHYSLEFITI